MAAKKKMNQKKFFQQRLDEINKVLSKLEVEVEKTVEKFVKRGEKSSMIIKKNFDEIIKKISASDIYSRATEKTEGVTKELRRLADDVVGKIRNLDLSAANSILKDVRSNIDQMLEKLQTIDVIEKTKDKAVQTKKQVLNVLKIPSQDEVSELSRKLNSLEKKVKTLSNRKKAA